MADMEMVPMASSNLRAAGYDPATQTLRIEYNSGTYDYRNVPEETWARLMGAPSKGSYVARWIKPAYSYVRID